MDKNGCFKRFIGLFKLEMPIRGSHADILLIPSNRSGKAPWEIQ
ncbi:hypothetical protein [Oculatella sp. LEGE 06141]|nr:hypothetical protein [Oculatella sp. LEGE 06141]